MIFAGLKLAAGTSLLLLVSAENDRGPTGHRINGVALWKLNDYDEAHGRSASPLSAWLAF